MIRRILKTTLTLAGPILTKSTAAGAFGIDAVMAVRPDGHFYLPRSLVKGRLRQSLVELGQKAAADDLFGPRAVVGDYDPHRGRVEFEDFIGPLRPDDVPYQTRIRIDPEKEAAEGGMMQMAESPFAAGEKIPFTGRISFSAADDTKADTIASLLMAGLRWTPAFGAQTGIGFGRLVCVRYTVEEANPAAGAGLVHRALDNNFLLWASYHPREAFCLARRRVNGNTFESDEFISGAAVKGVVATTLGQITGCDPLELDTLTGDWADLGKHLHQIRFTHAFPTRKLGVRPAEPPLSVVRVNGETYDTAQWAGAVLIDKRAPTYSVDWKAKDRIPVRSAHGWPDLKREMRVRTAIDYEKRRALNENLFAYDMVVPTDNDHWLGSIDFASVDEKVRNNVAEKLQRLMQIGLHGLGKTKTAMTVTIGDAWASAKTAKADPLVAGMCVVTLQTPALLADPRIVTHAAETSLEKAYTAVWADLSGHTLELGHFFARQEIAGGYLVKRFRPAGEPYEPYFLTMPGSVFMLKPTGRGDPAAVVQRWRLHGLPLPEWAEARYAGEHGALSWRTCPFRPEDGFGEVAVNLDGHFENLPTNIEVIQ